MKISVIIPSRGRTHTLIGALNSLHSLSSRKHEVTYGIVCDEDDPATIGTAKSLQAVMPVAYSVSPRSPSLGQLVNEMADYMPADVYLSLADDVLCLTPNWDDMIAQAWEKEPRGVWWWTPAREDQPVLYAIVSHKWKEANGGKLFTDYFPFWYDDLWLLSVWILVYEGPMLTIDAKIMDCPRHTHRMRDLRFWHNFYIAMNPTRIKQAKDIAAKLNFPQSKLVGASVGLPDLSISEALSKRLLETPKEFEESMEKIVDNQGDKEPVTEAYARAKARAEKLMQQMEFLKSAVPALERIAACG